MTRKKSQVLDSSEDEDGEGGMPSSQTNSQRQRAIDAIPVDNRHLMVKHIITYLLTKEKRKMSSKRADICKVVLKGHKPYTNAFPQLLEYASHAMQHTCGLGISEILNKKGTYILRSTLPREVGSGHLKLSDEAGAKLGLLTFILSSVFMSGDVIKEKVLWDSLKQLGFDADIRHTVLGDVKKLINTEFVRQNYLVITTIPNTDPQIHEYSWGPRAGIEFSKANILKTVAAKYNRRPQNFASIYESVQELVANTPEMDVDV